MGDSGETENDVLVSRLKGNAYLQQALDKNLFHFHGLLQNIILCLGDASDERYDADIENRKPDAARLAIENQHKGFVSLLRAVAACAGIPDLNGLVKTLDLAKGQMEEMSWWVAREEEHERRIRSLERRMAARFPEVVDG